MAVSTISDIEAIEGTPLAARALPQNTYDALAAGARRTPDASALTFFMSAESFERAHAWSYAELVGEITRAANMFGALGVTSMTPKFIFGRV